MTKLAHYDDLLRSYAANGISVKDAAANIGVHRSSVWKYATDNGIKFRHSLSRTNDDNHRAAMMRDDYLSGQTLDQIGKKHGITRERVRQIITETYGRLAKVGGQSARAAKNKAARRAKQDAASLQKNGCTYLQYLLLVRYCRKLARSSVSEYQTPIKAFGQQRNNARIRGIEWQFKLWDWWVLWQKSGKWDRRGRGAGKFVMCRKGDQGPYSVDNVYIAPAFENISASNRKNDLPIGVYAAKSGRFSAVRVVKKKQIYLGTFDTPDEAAIAYRQSLSREAA